MKCWKCQKNIEDPSGKKLAFRATCDHCSAWLHCCVNCRNYQPGLPNDCKIPDTDPIIDREACNFCDAFALAEQTFSTASPPLTDILERLFGEPADLPKKNFDDLFDD